VPEVGQVTERVARSPTDEAKGWYEFTSAIAVYEGLVAATVAEVGVMTTVAAVLKSGNRVASTDEAPKSWLKFRVIEPDCRPPVTVRQVEPKAVVSTSSLDSDRSTEVSDDERLVPLTVTL
jgi:hypothetical protein